MMDLVGFGWFLAGGGVVGGLVNSVWMLWRREQQWRFNLARTAIDAHNRHVEVRKHATDLVKLLNAGIGPRHFKTRKEALEKALAAGERDGT
jgi:hypothetical protein